MKKLTFYTFIPFIIIFIFPKPVSADTIPDSTQIYGVWNMEGSPYVVMGLAIIPADSTLTIEPGVQVKFKSSTKDSAFYIQYLDIGWIKSYGKLIAVGSEIDSIFFSSLGEGSWGGIHFENVSENIHFKFCKIEKCRAIDEENIPGETYTGGLAFKNAQAIIEYSNISNNYTGIFAWNSEVDLTQSRINNNITGADYKESSGKISYSLFNDNYDYGIHSRMSSMIIENNILEEQLNGISSYESFDTIIGNVVRNNLWSGIEITRCNPFVFRNVIYGSNSGIRCKGNPSIANNTIINNNYFGIYCGGYSKPILINNIIFGNGSLINYSESDTVVFANCLLQVNTLPAGLIDAGGNIFNEEPLFVDPGDEDFSLSAGSPCINTGISYFEWNSEVFLNLDPGQYNGISPDIGAIESINVGVKNNFSILETQSLLVVPNPSTCEMVRIFCRNVKPGEMYLIILNMTGAVVYQQEIIVSENVINISSWRPGIYLAAVYKEGKAIEQTKIMVQ